MPANELYIKNMVCNRCIKVVADELRNQNIDFSAIELGRVTLNGEIDTLRLTELSEKLSYLGFEIIDNKTSRIIEKIKTEIISVIHHNKLIDRKIKFSAHLSASLGLDYSYISHLFSSIEGITIEKYIILQKIEKIKELLVYDELSLTEIAYQLDYPSVQHLSGQFKKTTGLTPSFFRKMQEKKRIPIDKISNPKIT